MTKSEPPDYLERRLTVEVHAARISDEISDLLPEGMGFTLLLTETGEGRAHFGVQSTLQRESTTRMMKILLEKWGANQ